MTLKNRVPADIRAQYADTLLQSADPRKEARQLADQLGINFGVMWEWILREAKTRAEQALPASLSLCDLLQDDELQRVLTFVENDHTLVGLNRLENLIRTCEASSEEIRQLVLGLPPDGSSDFIFGTLLFRQEAPDDLLFRMLQEGRFETALCHRAGPRELLEAVLRKRPDCSEAILALTLSYATDPGVSHDLFLAFVREHWSCLQLRKWIAADCTPERRDPDKLASARNLLQEDPLPASSRSTMEN